MSEVPTLSFGFNTNAGHEITAAYMQEQWSKNLGIKSELKGVTFDTFVVERPKLVYSIARNAWGADYPHPDNFLRALFQQPERQQRRGVQQPRVRRADRARPAPSRLDEGPRPVQPGTGDPRR